MQTLNVPRIRENVVPQIPFWGRMPCALMLLGAILLGNPCPSTATEDNGMEWVRESFKAQNTVNYIGEIETLRFQSRQAEATIVRIEHRAPDFTRRWYLAPPSLFGDSVVLHNHQSYEFDEHHHVIIQSSRQWNEEAGRANHETLIGKNFRVIFAGSGIIAGRHIRRVNLLQRSSGHRLVSLAIDRQTNLPLERETYRSDGSLVYRMRFVSIRYLNPDRLPLTIFSTATPTGFRRVEKDTSPNEITLSQSVPSSLTPPSLPSASYPEVPDSLPEGFHMLRHTNTMVDGVNARQWIYTDGVRSLSLFASPLDHHPIFRGLHPRKIALNGKTANFVEEGSDALLSWQAEHNILTLVGDLTADELVLIAQQITKR